MNIGKGKSGLAKKIAIIIGTAISALGVQKTSATALPEIPATDGKNIDYAKEAAKPKKMPVLKLNPQNIGQSKLVAQHSSHHSHASHSSHSSHSSGGMFV